MNSKDILDVVGLCFASLLSALVVSNGAWAQQKFAINTTSEGVKSSYVQQHIIDVGDVPGHQVRILEVHRVHSLKQIELDGVKVLEEWDRGFSDYTNGVGPAHGWHLASGGWQQGISRMARNGVFGCHRHGIETRHFQWSDQNCRRHWQVRENPRHDD